MTTLLPSEIEMIERGQSTLLIATYETQIAIAQDQVEAGFYRRKINAVRAKLASERDID